MIHKLTSRERAAVLLASPTYTPNRLLEHVREALKVENDNQMCLLIGFNSAQMCRVRGKRERISANLVVAILDHTSFSIQDVRRLAGMPC